MPPKPIRPIRHPLSLGRDDKCNDGRDDILPRVHAENQLLSPGSFDYFEVFSCSLLYRYLGLKRS